MVFSFDAQICYDNHFSILGGEPINYVTHKGKITQFPGQNYKDIGQRFLDAASADGYDYFWFSGMMDDGNYSSLQHVLGNIGGKIAHARNIMQDIDLSKVHTLGLTFSDRDREKMPRYTLPNLSLIHI